MTHPFREGAHPTSPVDAESEGEAGARTAPEARTAMSEFNTSRLSRDKLRISSAPRAGWQPSLERIPRVGEQVYCTEGAAEVKRVLGKTSDGSRLLELSCESRPQPFFAASTNVLVRDDTHAGSGLLQDDDALGAS